MPWQAAASPRGGLVAGAVGAKAANAVMPRLGLVGPQWEQTPYSQGGAAAPHAAQHSQPQDLPSYMRPTGNFSGRDLRYGIAVCSQQRRCL